MDSSHIESALVSSIKIAGIIVLNIITDLQNVDVILKLALTTGSIIYLLQKWHRENKEYTKKNGKS